MTVECNPEDASPDLFGAWISAGVNRVSFGAQSMVPEVLAGLGRRHEPGSVQRAVSLAHGAGFGSVNVDLIFGGAGETDEDWIGVPHSDPRPGPAASAPELLRAHGRARNTTCGRSRPSPGRRRTGRPLRDRPTRCSPRPVTSGTRCPTGPDPATSAGTTSSTGNRASTGGSAARHIRTEAADGGGTSGPPSAT